MDTVVHILGTLCAFLITGAILVWGYVFWRWYRLDRKIEQVKINKSPSLKDEVDKLSLEIVSRHNRLRELWSTFTRQRFTEYGDVNAGMLTDYLNEIDLWAGALPETLTVLEHLGAPMLEVKVRASRLVRDFFQAKDDLLGEEDPKTFLYTLTWLENEAMYGAYGPRKE